MDKGETRAAPAERKALILRPVVNDPKDRNRYCGPAVISALTQMSTGQAARLLRAVSGRKMITGVPANELRKALHRCGIAMAHTTWDFNLIPKGKRPTLARWLDEARDSRHWAQSKVFLISAGGHWQLVQGRNFVCGLSKQVVSQRHSVVMRRARVRCVWELSQLFPFTMPVEALR